MTTADAPSMAPILVTGAAQRAGLHCVQRFLAAQQPVILTYRRHRPVIAELEQAGAVCLHADFSTTDGIEALIETLKQVTPALRGIVHNASVWWPDEPGRAGADHFETLFRVHMQAPYLINMACRELLEAYPGTADIIHMTDAVVRKGSAKHAAYVATKAGLESLTQSFASMLAPHIKVNAIAPALLAFNEGDDEAYQRKALDKSLLKIEPGFDVLYQTLRYVLDNPYLTGTTQLLDGGRSCR